MKALCEYVNVQYSRVWRASINEKMTLWEASSHGLSTTTSRVQEEEENKQLILNTQVFLSGTFIHLGPEYSKVDSVRGERTGPRPSNGTERDKKGRPYLMQTSGDEPRSRRAVNERTCWRWRDKVKSSQLTRIGDDESSLL